jgi:hypothetical protein
MTEADSCRDWMGTANSRNPAPGKMVKSNRPTLALVERVNFHNRRRAEEAVSPEQDSQGCSGSSSRR